MMTSVSGEQAGDWPESPIAMHGADNELRADLLARDSSAGGNLQSSPPKPKTPPNPPPGSAREYRRTPMKRGASATPKREVERDRLDGRSAATPILAGLYSQKYSI
jgi:hypothetical protein